MFNNLHLFNGNSLDETRTTLTIVWMSIMLIIVIESPTNNVSAKKHTERFNVWVSDGKDHQFDASRFGR